MLKVVVRVPLRRVSLFGSLKMFQRSEVCWCATLPTKHSFRIQVGILLCITTAYLTFRAVYWYLITNYGNPAALGKLVWYVCFTRLWASRIHFVTLQEPFGKPSGGYQNYNFNSVFKPKIEALFNVSDTLLEIAPRVNTIYHRVW
jgi:hypothetical protein